MTGTLITANTIEIPVRPKTLNVTQSSVLRTRHATSLPLPSGEHRHPQPAHRAPASFYDVLLANQCRQRVTPNQLTTGNHGSKHQGQHRGLNFDEYFIVNRVSPAKNTKAAQPNAAIIGNRRSVYQLTPGILRSQRPIASHSGSGRVKIMATKNSNNGPKSASGSRHHAGWRQSATGWLVAVFGHCMILH